MNIPQEATSLFFVSMASLKILSFYIIADDPIQAAEQGVTMVSHI